MKLTCSNCSRRLMVRPLQVTTCKCGKEVYPFSAPALLERFSNYDYETITFIRKAFFNGSSIEEKQRIIDTILGIPGGFNEV